MPGFLLSVANRPPSIRNCVELGLKPNRNRPNVEEHRPHDRPEMGCRMCRRIDPSRSDRARSVFGASPVARDVQYRILSVCRFLVAEIHPRGQSEVYATRGQPILLGAMVLAALRALHAARF